MSQGRRPHYQGRPLGTARCPPAPGLPPLMHVWRVTVRPGQEALALQCAAHGLMPQHSEHAPGPPLPISPMCQPIRQTLPATADDP